MSESAEFVIRSKEDRCINERVRAAEHASRYAVYKKVRDEVQASPLRLRKTIALPQTSQRVARQADLEIRAQALTMKHPKHRRNLAAVDCSVVHVKEASANKWLLSLLAVVFLFGICDRILIAMLQ